MKRQRTRKRWALWACLGVVVLAVAVAAAYLISTLPFYDSFYKDVNSLETVRKELKDIEEICVPEASWIGLTDGTYRLRMDGRFLDAEPEGYYVKGTAQCNGKEISVSIDCLPSVTYGGTVQQKSKYRDIVIEYVTFEGYEQEDSTSKHATGFDLHGYSYSVNISFSTEGMSETEKENMTEASKYWAMEIAHRMIDSVCEE